jgi:hypothetical protein
VKKNKNFPQKSLDAFPGGHIPIPVNPVLAALLRRGFAERGRCGFRTIARFDHFEMAAVRLSHRKRRPVFEKFLCMILFGPRTKIDDPNESLE